MKIEYGIIGGSGFYHLFSEDEKKSVKTPFGEVIVSISAIEGRKVAFISRHNSDHSIPPHLVNYRANIFAFHSLGVRYIIASSAVGSLIKTIKPGDFVIPDQFIDFTIGRPKTFFDGKFKIKLHNGQIRDGVVHIDVTHPYCSNIRTKIISNLQKTNENVHEKGVYVCTEGPRFETPAEIKAFQILGGTIVGMTSVSECVLAKELDICYASVCLVTNYASGMQAKVSVEEVLELFEKKKVILKTLVFNTIKLIDASQDV
ncbi:MAG TPA: S-methyl-5'-thioadenosine phosphorylase [candidate division Zixibacteria bacterium]|nr:S-methyl-5'-thioadenosine phosphorylase [candidate division Zixibacteria bacterium]